MSLDSFKDCNQKHSKYVPVKDFRKCYIPEKYQNDELCEFLKALAQTTVKLTINFTSPNRPDVWPDTDVPYPYIDIWGSGKDRVASGWIDQIVRFSPQENLDCRCANCRSSTSPSKEWGDVTVVTATHCVFDRFEAEGTTCRLFYDADDSPLVTIKGRNVAYVDVEMNRSALVCSTCDVQLLEKLTGALKHCKEAKKKVADHFKGADALLEMIVSHPHGVPKQISFGECVEKKTDRDGNSKFTYSTPACSGSDGAPVVNLNNIRIPSYLPHSGPTINQPRK